MVALSVLPLAEPLLPTSNFKFKCMPIYFSERYTYTHFENHSQKTHTRTLTTQNFWARVTQPSLNWIGMSIGCADNCTAAAKISFPLFRHPYFTILESDHWIRLETMLLEVCLFALLQ